MQQSSYQYLYRVDASVATGIGHLMRCLALAQEAVRNGEKCLFLVSQLHFVEDILKRYAVEYCETESPPGSLADGEATALLCRRYRVRWLIVDGYHFTPDFYQAVNSAETRLAVFEDFIGEGFKYAALVINPSMNSKKDEYKSRNPDCGALLGPQYALLGSEFLAIDAAEQPPAAAEVDNLLVSFGGSDPQNVSTQVLKAISQLECPPQHVKVLSGLSNKNFDSLSEFAAGMDTQVEILKFSDKMPDLICWADIALAAGGGTLWQLAYLGVPVLIITTSDSQIAAAQYLDKQIGSYIGHHDELSSNDIGRELEKFCTDFALRKRLSADAKHLVDGKGADRILKKIKELS